MKDQTIYGGYTLKVQVHSGRGRLEKRSEDGHVDSAAGFRFSWRKIKKAVQQKGG